MSSSDAEQFETLAGEYQIIALLGSGTFGSVYRARERGSGMIVAMKLIKLDPATGEIDHSARTEVTTLQTLAACENIATCGAHLSRVGHGAVCISSCSICRCHFL
jgi:serine/threonine protein kinase